MNDDLPVYSPSETEDYLTCPRFRVLRKVWVPRGCGGWTPHQTLGTAIHAGLAQHYAPAGDLDTPLDVALRSLNAEYQEGSEWSLEGCTKLVTRGLDLALKTELLSPEGRVVGVETWMGHSRLDLVTREPYGLVVTDHKVTLELEKKKLEYRLRDLDPSWQLLHGAWACLQKYGEAPAWSRAHLIVLAPRPFVYVHSLKITAARLADYEGSALQHWSEMHGQRQRYDSASILPPMNTRSCHRYGRKCEFYDGCHVYDGDESKFPTIYDRKED